MKTFKKLDAETKMHSGVVIVKGEDEQRLEELCQQVAEKTGYDYWRWTFTTGLVCLTDSEKTAEGTQELAPAMNCLINWDKGPALVVAHDLISFLRDVDKSPITPRTLKDIARLQKQLNARMVAGEFTEEDGEKAAKCVMQLVICDDEETPKSYGLSNYTLELPDRDAVGVVLDRFLEHREVKGVERDALLDASAGLQCYQVEAALGLTFARTGSLEADQVSAYKRDAVKAKGITWLPSDPAGFDAIGGLEPFKTWFRQRALAFDRELAAEYNVDPPRGVVVSGPPGCAKTRMASVIGSVWCCPVINVDIGMTRSKWAGESERGFANILQTIDVISPPGGAPAVVLLDEADRALSGSLGAGDLDAGTAGRVFQTLLSWMSERRSNAFLFFTSNHPELLPVELTRPGRIDSLWWVDFPNANERRAIIEIYRAQYHKAANVDVDQLVERSAKTTGAEIEAAFRESAIAAMAEHKPSIQTIDVVVQLDKMPKVADTFQMSEGMQAWRAAARKANSLEDPAELVDMASPTAASSSSPGLN